jgi:hypothetical protein
VRKGETVIDESEVYRVMFESVKTGDLTEIIRAAYRVMGGPLIITDVTYTKLTEIYPPEPQGDSKWDVYLPGIELDTDSVLHIYQNNFIEQMKDHFEPIMMNEGYFEDSPRLTGPVVVEGELAGYVSMLCRRRECSPLQLRNISIVADAVAIYLQGRGGGRHGRASIGRLLARKLVFGEFMDEEELDRLARLAGADLRPPYTILMVGTSLPYHHLISGYLENRLDGPEVPLLLCQEDNVVYIFLYGVDDEKKEARLVGGIDSAVRTFSFSTGVSEPFSDLHDVRMYRKQAETAFTLGEKLEEGKTVHRYRDLVLPAIFSASAEVLGRENCFHPAYRKIEEYDLDNGTEYLATLRELLYSTGDHARICSDMHIHRNTLNYRLGRLQDIAGIDLNDSATLFHLYLTFRMVDNSVE